MCYFFSVEHSRCFQYKLNGHNKCMCFKSSTAQSIKFVYLLYFPYQIYRIVLFVNLRPFQPRLSKMNTSTVSTNDIVNMFFTRDAKN